jgi:RNA 3'-phosphate cyclase
MIVIDGSYGEGGGQILRTALSLSIIFKKPFKLINIRAGRPKPGLQPQHLTCVKAAAELSKAEIKGAELNSKELIFIPKETPIKTTYVFDIKTAGSTGLLFQTLLYPLAFSEGGTLILKGGTHVPFSPCYHYIKHVFLPVVKNFGLKAEIFMEKAGFYPKGGGIIKAEVFPWKNFLFPQFEKGFSPKKVFIFSIVSDKLPRHILERQANSAFTLLSQHGFQAETQLEIVKTESPGTAVFIYSIDKDEVKRVGFTELGRKGYPAEEVGRSAVYKFLKFLNTEAQVEEHLGDQLLIPLSLLLLNSDKKAFSYTVSKVSKHLLTQAWLIPQFIPQINVTIKEIKEKGEVKVERR